MQVRQARAALAVLLAERDGAHEEAVEQFRRALTEPGDAPPDWQLLRDLGRLALRAGGTAAGGADYVATMVDAMAAAPVAVREGLAGTIGQFLARSAESVIVGLDGTIVARLEELARPESPEVARLAVRIHAGRGELGAAVRILQDVPTLARREDLQDVVTAARAQDLLEHERPDLARILLDGPSTGPSTGPARPADLALRALSFFAEDEPSAVLEYLSAVAPTAELTLIQALAHLRAAAGEPRGAGRAAHVEHARRAVTEVGRDDRHRAEALLVRGQVLLEGALDLEEGRRVLARALRHLGDGPEHLQWWRVQERVRDDELHRYFRVELAAARGSWDTVAELASRMTTLTTEYVQDGAGHRMWADALRARGEDDRAAELYRQAAGEFAVAERNDWALDCARAALGIDPSVAATLSLVELLWRASLPTSTGETQLECGAAVGEAIELLDRLDPDLGEEDAPWACLLRGLLGRRTHEGAGAATGWTDLPPLLLAVLARPDEAVWAGHLAWALDAAGLHRAGAWFAQRASAARPDDSWLLETRVVCTVNWHGRLDEDTTTAYARLLTVSPEDPERLRAWGTYLHGLVRLFDGDLDGLPAELGSVTFDALWARHVRAHAVLRCDGPAAARPLLEALVQESRDGDRPDVEAETLVLLDPVSAPARVAEGQAAGRTTASAASLSNALVALASTAPGPDGASAVVDLVGRLVRPYTLRELGSVLLPGLAAMHGTVPGLRSAVATVGEAVRDRLTRLAAEPPLDIELRTGEAEATDRDAQDAVAVLLGVSGHTTTDGCDDVVAALRALDCGRWPGPVANRLARDVAAQRHDRR